MCGFQAVGKQIQGIFISDICVSRHQRYTADVAEHMHPQPYSFCFPGAYGSSSVRPHGKEFDMSSCVTPEGPGTSVTMEQLLCTNMSLRLILKLANVEMMSFHLSQVLFHGSWGGLNRLRNLTSVRTTLVVSSLARISVRGCPILCSGANPRLLFCTT